MKKLIQKYRQKRIQESAVTLIGQIIADEQRRNFQDWSYSLQEPDAVHGLVHLKHKARAAALNDMLRGIQRRFPNGSLPSIVDLRTLQANVMADAGLAEPAQAKRPVQMRSQEASR